MEKQQNDVVMPTKEDLAQFEEEGLARQKRRGKVEIVIGLLFFLAGLFSFFEPEIMSEYQNSSRIKFGATFYGLIQLGVGLSRHFERKSAG